ncbi:glycosyltransferase [Magnetospira sp. QH-2]|uniref:glycosyltransferase n=1 Tax=Magnetospira sp. (strain QH-2) TaxID=1288970 RepID=UPI0003E812E0|nr:glycosyltransferase [Magnetospira sp. QH-2]CCQ73900.1 Putative glycosyltransferase group 1 [Magnetospira sp. QH-2]
MLITMIDDSVPFDGASPAERPLGGAERAFASLAAALARRGHDVTAITRTEDTSQIEDVTWVPWDLPRPPMADLLIAFRRPGLLDEMPDVYNKVLWLAQSAGFLTKPRTKAILDRHKPKLVFLGRAHLATFESRMELQKSIVAPGLSAPFLADAKGIATGPTAVVTSHPLRGLDRILEVWCEKIQTRRSEARLKVYSASLFKALEGGVVPSNLAGILAQVKRARIQNVEVVLPGTEAEMAEAYRSARAHLYPRADDEIFPWTLAESQACGCPAVTFAGAATAERVRNGETAYMVPDDEAFANLTLDLLSGGSTYDSLHAQALEKQRKPDWDEVAAEFEIAWR